MELMKQGAMRTVLSGLLAAFAWPATLLAATDFRPVCWVVNDRKFSARTVFFSHTKQSVVLFHEPATKRTSQPNSLSIHDTPCV